MDHVELGPLCERKEGQSGCRAGYDRLEHCKNVEVNLILGDYLECMKTLQQDVVFLDVPWAVPNIPDCAIASYIWE